MKVVVTGGAGFIGSNLVNALIDDGECDVWCIDDESADNGGNFRWNPKANNVKASISDLSVVAGVVDGVDTVFHMAAESRVQGCQDNPSKAVDTNVNSLASLLHLCEIGKVKSFVYSSTSSVYGLRPPPHSVSTEPDLINMYACSKYCGELICKQYADKMKVIIFRYFNVFGPGCPSKGTYAPVVSRFLEQKSEGKPLTIVGTGEQSRDYVHVDTVVKLNKYAHSAPDDLSGNVYNVGMGWNWSVKEIADMISSDQVHVPERPNEAWSTLADATSTMNDLGWDPDKDFDKLSLEAYIKGRV